jgi:hypothetical protein
MSRLTIIIVAAIIVSIADAHAQYYVIHRYYCADNVNQSDRGTCDVTTQSPQSCQAALQAHNQDISSRGDVCRVCVPGQIDNTKHYANRWESIGGGPCQGM